MSPLKDQSTSPQKSIISFLLIIFQSSASITNLMTMKRRQIFQSMSSRQLRKGQAFTQSLLKLPCLQSRQGPLFSQT
ncbi:hypothetical protein FGO68_gene12196 [Halteria grandinella]|uniref:Uncharacterized protein n=1 Tax=Halteria grandinella TaxID=5974 RepID=A0A8J8P7Q3_HALGN|nr:hypothetical protein FGO68_gene12196 [Halteria grandinella]